MERLVNLRMIQREGEQTKRFPGGEAVFTGDQKKVVQKLAELKQTSETGDPNDQNAWDMAERMKAIVNALEKK